MINTKQPYWDTKNSLLTRRDFFLRGVDNFLVLKSGLIDLSSGKNVKEIDKNLNITYFKIFDNICCVILGEPDESLKYRINNDTIWLFHVDYFMNPFMQIKNNRITFLNCNKIIEIDKKEEIDFNGIFLKDNFLFFGTKIKTKIVKFRQYYISYLYVIDLENILEYKKFNNNFGIGDVVDIIFNPSEKYRLAFFVVLNNLNINFFEYDPEEEEEEEEPPEEFIMSYYENKFDFDTTIINDYKTIKLKNGEYLSYSYEKKAFEIVNIKFYLKDGSHKKVVKSKFEVKFDYPVLRTNKYGEFDMFKHELRFKNQLNLYLIGKNEMFLHFLNNTNLYVFDNNNDYTDFKGDFLIRGGYIDVTNESNDLKESQLSSKFFKRQFFVDKDNLYLILKLSEKGQIGPGIMTKRLTVLKIPIEDFKKGNEAILGKISMGVDSVFKTGMKEKYFWYKNDDVDIVRSLVFPVNNSFVYNKFQKNSK